MLTPVNKTSKMQKLTKNKYNYLLESTVTATHRKQRNGLRISSMKKAINMQNKLIYLIE